MPLPLELIVYLSVLGAWISNAPVPEPDPVRAVVAVAACGVAGLLLGHLIERLSRGGKVRAGWSAAADWAARAGIAVLSSCALVASGWPLAWLYPDDIAGHGFFLPSVLGILPYLVVFYCVWWPLFPWHARTRAGSWTRGDYLRYQTSYGLYLLVVWLPFLAAAEYLPLNGPLLLALGVLVAWVGPWGIKWLWGCKPADLLWIKLRVRELQKRAGVAFHGVYLWEPGGGATLNAAAVGWSPPFQYLFITRALLRWLPPEEFDAVVAHELGHVRHRHLLLYLVAAMTFMAGMWELFSAAAIFTVVEQVGLEILAVVLYWRFLFGWMSRRMERQADLYALELMGGRPEPMVNALERIAVASGTRRHAASWHHGGIAERVWFLREAARRPEIGRRHHAIVAWLRLGVWTLAAGLFTIWAVRFAEQRSIPEKPPVLAAGPESTARCWRRVAAALPDDPTAPLALARQVWRERSLEGRVQAMAWGREARKRARNPEEKTRIDRKLADWSALSGVEP